jgi:ABC-type transport system involved in cytochrome c biogenesis permease subunit
MVHIENGSHGDELTPAGARWWAAAAMTAVNALTSAGFALAGVVATLPGPSASARSFALYAAARSVPLAIAVLALVALRATRPLAALALTMALVQACDAAIGVVQHDVGKTLGPAVFAVATCVAGGWLWRRDQRRT